jgi:non-ribosomal peptide synthetase component E (peptide arylation enzyme)
VAIETNAQWFAAVNQQLKARGISNVTYLLINNQADIEAKLQNLPDFTIVSDDSVHGFNRSRFLNIILARYKAMRVLVLDNYGDQALFPDHYNKSITDMLALCPPAWVGADYDDARWCGKGTRILSAE